MPVRKDFIKETNENRGHSNFKEQHEKGLKCENTLSSGSCRRMFINTGGVMVGKEVQNDI